MVDTNKSTTNPNQSAVYQIRLKGHLRTQWRDWFGDMTIMLSDDGTTFLTGILIDQAALHGLLKKIRDLGMPLLSINRMKSGQPDLSDNEI